jgi:asparagine synthase (glutamine-hydrolysing)
MPPATLYKNIEQLLSGSQLIIKLVNGKCKIVRIEDYIPPTPNEKEAGRIESISNSTLTLLDDTLQDLIPCKDRISVLLSGGLDSSILFKICESKYGIDTTYSTGYPFEDPNTNKEKTYALSAADAFETKHSYYEVTNEEYLRGVIEGISAAEEPLNHLQSVMMYLLFKGGLPQNKNIVITGGGAEIWGLELQNIIHRSNKTLFKLLSTYPLITLLKTASDITGRGGGYIDLLNSTSSTNIKKSYAISDPRNIIWSMQHYGSEEWICKYFGINESDIIKGRYNTIRQYEGRSIYDIISILDYFGDESVTQSIWAKLGESQGKIIYYPYTQNKLVKYAYSIPWEIKLKKPKNVLRNVARQCKIPEFIITRPKTGFGIRRKNWAERGDIFEPLVPLAKKVFDEKQIRNMQSLDPKKAMTYWNILNYSIWKRLCINNEPVEILLDELN